MYLVVKQPDGLKLQYSVFSIVVAYGGNRLPAEFPPQASVTIFCHLRANTRYRNGSTRSGINPLFTYLAVRKGIKDKHIPQNLTKGRCMAGKEKHCSFNPKPVLLSTVTSSRRHGDTPATPSRLCEVCCVPHSLFLDWGAEGWR